MPFNQPLRRPSMPLKQRGMSMIEMMVAVVISMIGTLVIFQVFQVNESIRRETTNGADTQTSGLVALTTIERDLRTAAFGFNESQAIGCNMTMYDLKRAPSDVTPFRFVPIRIIANNNTVPDVLQVTFGSPSSSPGKVEVKAAITPANSSDPVTPNQTYGFDTGDVVMLWQNGQPCTIVEVTKINPTTIEHNPGNYFNTITGQNRTARYNKPGGSGLSFTGSPNGGQLSNLGPNPVRNEYTVRNNMLANPSQNYQFTVNNLFAEAPSVVPVAEQIVHFKAEYGIDDGLPNGTVSPRDVGANDGIVDKFTNVDPLSWHQVIAVRLAIVTRSLQAEKADPNTGTCNVTADWGSPNYPVVWARGPNAPNGIAIDVRTESDWRCYRYRVFETTVPLRNMLWKGETT